MSELTDLGWLRVEEVADLLGVAVRTVQWKARRHMWATREVPNPNGGRPALLYAVSSLPEEAQAALAARRLAALQAPLLGPDGTGSGTGTALARLSAAPEPGEPARRARAFAAAPAWKRDVALAREALVKATLVVPGSRGKSLAGEPLRAALRAYAEAAGPVPHVTARADGRPRVPSVSTVYVWRALYKEHGVEGLLPGWGKRKGETSVSTPLFRAFSAVYLQQGRPSAEEARRQALAWAEARALPLPPRVPTAKAFLRRLEREVPESALYLARYGEDAHRGEYGQFVLRDVAALAPGQVVVSDHRRLDVTVVCPETGRPVRPWLTAWVCMRTHRRLAWSLHTSAPSAADVFLTFKWLCEAQGFLPDVAYLDNGRDYTALDFGGDQHDQVKKHHRGRDAAQGLLSLLGVTALFARPRNARAKVIEPLFKATITRLEKHLVGYTGGSALDKPEKLKKEIAGGRLITFGALDRLVSQVHAALNAAPSKGRALGGESPDQAWARLLPEGGDRRILTPEAASLLLLRTSRPVRIGRNGATATLPGRQKATFWGEWMVARKGETVVARTDPRRPGHAYVFSQDGAFLGEAWTDQHTAAALAQTPAERSRLASLLDAQAKELKETRATVAHARRLPDEELALLPGRVRGGEEGMHLVVGTLQAGGPDQDSSPIDSALAPQGGAPYAGGHAPTFGQAPGAPVQTPYDTLRADAEARRAEHTGPLYALPPPPPPRAIPLFPSDFLEPGDTDWAAQDRAANA